MLTSISLVFKYIDLIPLTLSRKNGQTIKIGFSFTTRVGGVGLLVSKDLVKCVSGSKRISDRIISVTFNGNPRVVITVVYAPTESAEDDDKDSFYDDLINHTSSNIKRHNIHIVLVDFNARLGEAHEASSNIIGSTLMHSLTSNNDERLLDYCLESKLIHAQSHFPQPLDLETPNRLNRATWSHLDQ